MKKPSLGFPAKVQVLLCALALLVTSFAYALGQQTTAKRALTHQDYDSWHSIQSPQISRDGKFIAYAFMAQDGDSEIVVRNLASGAEWRAPEATARQRRRPMIQFRMSLNSSPPTRVSFVRPSLPTAVSLSSASSRPKLK